MRDVTDSAPKTGVEEVLKVSEFFLDYISEREGCYDAPLKASQACTIGAQDRMTPNSPDSCKYGSGDDRTDTGRFL